MGVFPSCMDTTLEKSVQNREQLPVSPDAAEVEEMVGKAPLQEEMLDLLRVIELKVVDHVQEASASRTDVCLGHGGGDVAAVLLDALQEGGHDPNLLKSNGKTQWHSDQLQAGVGVDAEVGELLLQKLGVTRRRNHGGVVGRKDGGREKKPASDALQRVPASVGEGLDCRRHPPRP